MTSPNMAALLARARAANKNKNKVPEAEAEAEAEAVPATAPNAKILHQSEPATIATVPSAPEPSAPMSKAMELKARMAAIRAKKLQKAGAPVQEKAAASSKVPSKKEVQELVEAGSAQTIGMQGEVITYNKQQQEFIDIMASGKSCVLIGAAGTGKTTCSQGGISGLLQAKPISILEAGDHKYLVSGAAGVLIISYTRRAVNNIRKVQSEDLKNNCITAHKLLEYQPEYFEVEDPETGGTRKTMQFLPARNQDNPLTSTIHTIVVEEGSMMSLELFALILTALPHKVQWIFIGDIQQLPPVFGSAILGYKMLELPLIELTEVYRQALESPIIRLAHRILSGKPIPATEFDEWKVAGQLTIHPWKKKLAAEIACQTICAFFTNALDNGLYNPDEDMILIPYNKACGTIEVNKHLANHIAKKAGKDTFEVIAGFNKLYFSVGDKVLYDKEDAEIISIESNGSYSGARPQPESKTLDYWGYNPKLAEESWSYGGDQDVDALLDAAACSEERVTQASHAIKVKLADTEKVVDVTKASDVNNLLHAYSLTVHKSQGSEWRKVFFVLHQSHAAMLQRELLYTGVTRAREELYIICEPESLVKGIKSQRIKGNTLEEKANFFKGKVDDNTRMLLAGITNKEEWAEHKEG